MACWVVLGGATSAAAITVSVDYTYDTSNFFGSGNPQGATAGMQARASMEAAASFFSDILNDTFSAIPLPPPPYYSSVSDGVVTWFFEERFEHPSTGAPLTILNPTVPADTYLIYAGARSLPGDTAGVGSVGGFRCCTTVSGTNSFSPADINYINSSTTNFENAAVRRGEPSGFVRWGGTIAFDTDLSPAWHFNHTTLPSGNVRDFYSVAVHELGHALGFGAQSSNSETEWESLVSGSTFTGINARAQYGGNPVPLYFDLAHWEQGTPSVVYGGTAPQEAAMDPNLQNGIRKVFTELDAAALRDIGWEVVPLPGPFGDYNNNGVVDAADYVVWRKRLGQSVTIPNDQSPGMVSPADYTVWRTNFGKTLSGGSGATLAAAPEPVGALLALVGGCGLFVARRKRRR